MFKLNKKNSLVKKVLVSGAALLMLAGVGAGASNVNIHASGFNLSAIENSARKDNPAKDSYTGRYTPHTSVAKARVSQQKQANTNFDKGMVLKKNAKPAKNPNRKCSVNYKNFNHKSRRHVARKARKRVRRNNKVRKHVARRAKRNTRGYKNYEVKNLAMTLNRLDKKAQRSHGRKRANLIKNMRHVNGRLGKLVGKKGKKTTRGYKNFEVKNLAKTLNRVDAKAVKSHGRKYAKLIRTLKSANYSLIQLAK